MNYFYLDKYGLVQGTNSEEEAKKRGEYVASETVLAKNGDPVWTPDGSQFENHVYIYTKEQVITINENIGTGHNVKLAGIPKDMQEVAVKLGYKDK